MHIMLLWKINNLTVCETMCSFIKKYGTHIVVGVSMGGQDVVYVKQEKSSPLTESEIKEHLEKLGDQLFTGTCAVRPSHCKSRDHKTKVRKILFTYHHPRLKLSQRLMT